MQMKLDKWNIAIGDGAPLVVMAGLNVLEDKALALAVCAELKSICADLGLPYIFKASFDKANRSSVSSYRGPGEADGLAMLTKVKAMHNVPIVTDLHTPEQAEPVAAIADVVQLPAFLVRQTDLVVAAAKAVGAQQGDQAAGAPLLSRRVRGRRRLGGRLERVGRGGAGRSAGRQRRRGPVLSRARRFGRDHVHPRDDQAL